VTISEADFRYVAELVRVETSMQYDVGKEYLVQARLQPLARSAGEPDVAHYVRRLRADAVERRRAVDALTINETSWFRDREPFRVFVEVMLPRLVEARAGRRELRIWSAASSSGQEAYSLAMLCEEHLPAGWSLDILATDVSEAMVERVRAGRYGQVEMNRGLPATQLVQHFRRVGTEWEVSQRLRSVVHARQLNLAAPLPHLGTFDVIFLRNVLIYFDQATKRDILGRIQACLSPDGYLVLGASETTLDAPDRWTTERHDRVSLQRPSPTTPTTPAVGAAADRAPATTGA
jgi:chemotaxis protein methyltransferase CheR